MRNRWWWSQEANIGYISEAQGWHGCWLRFRIPKEKKAKEKEKHDNEFLLAWAVANLHLCFFKQIAANSLWKSPHWLSSHTAQMLHGEDWLQVLSCTQSTWGKVSWTCLEESACTSCVWYQYICHTMTTPYCLLMTMIKPARKVNLTLQEKSFVVEHRKCSHKA